MVPEITFGHHILVVLDVGCGVTSFGAYLLPQNVITLSVGSKDVHENHIQIVLEHGVPTMVAAFANHCVLYPSQAFEQYIVLIVVSIGLVMRELCYLR